MTKIIADLLGIEGPMFQLGLRQLEAGSGRQSHDIRLTTAVTHGVQKKLRELGLDPRDTTGQELYAVMGERLKGDEERLLRSLKGASSPDDNPIAHLALALLRELQGQNCFALKPSVARKILRVNIPKKTMKTLGYRSPDSMLKHESVASLYAAAWLIENDAWVKRLDAAYGKLTASDFEVRSLHIEHPMSKRWQELANTVVARKKHNVLSFNELGSIVLLPFPEKRPQLAALVTSVLALHAVNEIQAASTLLKLRQMQPGFGASVQQVVKGDITLPHQLFERPLSWTVAQQFYARTSHALHKDIFEPVVQTEDLVWHQIEAILARIEPTLSFWKGTGHLALLKEGEVVSCNLTDVVLSHCNQLPYRYRLKAHFRKTLRTELLLCYLDAQQLERAIMNSLQPKLAAETATI